MSWHCLQEPEEEFSVDAYLAVLRSARWKLNATLAKSSCNGSGTESCLPSQSGTTFARLTESHGAALSMSCQEDSHARISAQRERVRVSRGVAPGSGLRCTESFAKFDHASRSWRTPQCSLLGDYIEFSGTWPKRGMMRRGWCWELPMWELRTKGIESGFWQRTPAGKHLIPTPTACNAPNKGSNTKGPKSLLDVARTGWNPGESWPTPQASDYKRANDIVQTCLNRMQNGHQMGLPETVKLREFFPTPLANDAKNNGGPGQQARKSPQLGAVVGGALNPPWVEWLMGWPVEWTDLKPLEMGKFRSWLQLHSVTLKKLLNLN